MGCRARFMGNRRRARALRWLLWIIEEEPSPRSRGTSYAFRTGACKSISYQSTRRRSGANNAFTTQEIAASYSYLEYSYAITLTADQ